MILYVPKAMPPYFTPKTNPEGSNVRVDFIFTVRTPPHLTRYEFTLPHLFSIENIQACAARLSTQCSLKTKTCALATARRCTAG